MHSCFLFIYVFEWLSYSKLAMYEYYVIYVLVFGGHAIYLHLLSLRFVSRIELTTHFLYFAWNTLSAMF